MGAPSRTGQDVGAFTLGELLGAGGMGEVYAAVHRGLERDVAVKLLPLVTPDPDRVRRFIREAKAMSRLHHPNIVTVLDFGTADDGTMWIAMERLRGPTLREVLERHGPLAWRAAVDVACQICDALEVAHTERIIHRDLKPENVFVLPGVGPSGQFVKVVDFGIAQVGGEAAITTAGGVCGTPHYMSPEEASGREVTPASDVYSVGVLLFELLTGDRPFNGTTPSILIAHATAPPPDVRSIRPDLPADLAAMLLDAMAKSPADRPATAAALRARLQSIDPNVVAPFAIAPIVLAKVPTNPMVAPLPTLTHAGRYPEIPTVRDEPIPPPLMAQPRRRGWIVAAAVVVVVAAGLLAQWVVRTDEPAPRETAPPAVLALPEPRPLPPRPKPVSPRPIRRPLPSEPDFRFATLPDFPGRQVFLADLTRAGGATSELFGQSETALAARLPSTWEVALHDEPTAWTERVRRVSWPGHTNPVELRLGFWNGTLFRIYLRFFERVPSLGEDLAAALRRPPDDPSYPDYDDLLTARWDHGDTVIQYRAYVNADDTIWRGISISYLPVWQLAFPLMEAADSVSDAVRAAEERIRSNPPEALRLATDALATMPTFYRAAIAVCRARRAMKDLEGARAACERARDQTVEEPVRKLAVRILTKMSAALFEVPPGPDANFVGPPAPASPAVTPSPFPEE